MLVDDGIPLQGFVYREQIVFQIHQTLQSYARIHMQEVQIRSQRTQSTSVTFLKLHLLPELI